VLLIAFSVAAQKVTTTADKSYDFKSAKRYAWRQNHIITRQGRASDVQIDQKIVENVNRILGAKGFIEDPKNPDFFISYEAGGSDLSAKIEGAYSPAAPSSTAAPNAIYDIPQNLWYSVDGHVTFHIVDAKSNKPVWSALATKKINDPHKAMKDMPKQVEQFVSKAFQKFPPNAK
jgi:hypothetical protein